MAKVLILYATTEGQTRKIAQFLADRAAYRDHAVDMHDVTCLPAQLDLESYDGVILAASLHMDQHQPAMHHFVVSHLLTLQNVKTAFLSVSLSAAGDKSDQSVAYTCMERFLLETRWSPKKRMMVAGALRFPEHDFFRRWMLRRIAKVKHAPADASGDHEFTDWEALSKFFDEFMATSY